MQPIFSIIRRIAQELSAFFLRKRISEVNFVLGSLTWREWRSSFAFGFTRRGQLKEGTFCQQFNQYFAGSHGLKYAFGFGAGRMALYAILKAIGVKEGDEVLLPGFTCVVVPNALIYAG